VIRRASLPYSQNLIHQFKVLSIFVSSLAYFPIKGLLTLATGFCWVGLQSDLALRAMGESRLLLNSYMVQFLETGYLHGDPHPGNFILMGVLGEE